MMAIVLLSVSCGSIEQTTRNDSSEQKDNMTGVLEEQNDSKNKSQYGPIRVTGDLHDSMILEHGAKTQHGYYEIIQWVGDMLPEGSSKSLCYGNIVYTDYSSCKRVYLCNTPGCAHNGADCTSFVQFSVGATLFTDYSENHLFLMSKGGLGREISSEDLAMITEMDMDGSNRRTVCILSSTESFRDNSVQIASDDYIYATVEHLEIIEGVPTSQYVLERIWFADGRREVVCPISNSKEKVDTAFCVWNNEDLIVKQREYDGENSPVYFCRLTQDGEYKERYGPLYTLGYFRNEFIITGEEDGVTAVFTRTDLETGDSRTIIGVPAEAPKPGRLGLFGSDGYRINLHYLDGDENSRDYVLDFSDESWKEFTLKRDSYADKALTLIADAGEDYLVIKASHDSTITLTDYEGIPHTYDYPNRPEYALISKEDYWNCNPDYRVIEDTIP